jgi:hypothetical protein
VSFDWRPLVAAVDPRQARDYVRMLRAQGRVRDTSAAAVVVIVLAIALALGACLVVGIGILATIGREGGFIVLLVAAIPILALLGIVGLALFLVRRAAHDRAERWLKLDRFAQANAMSFVPSLPAPQLPGMIFHRGSDREASDLVRGDRPRFVEFANYRFVTGSGKNRATHRWGYVAVKLDVPLPHIVLDATGNNSVLGSNLPISYDRDQRLSLEGDFDRYFSLYCPAGYERDALYLFTPDIMARFIDNAAQLDVEIVDDWLFLYAKRDLSTLDPATWAWLFSAVAALLDKFTQWGRWRDDHLAAAAAGPAVTGAAASIDPSAGATMPVPLVTPPPGVAPAGRRLKGGISWVSVLLFVIFGIVWCFFTFNGFGLLVR